jgi:hypothetical protein
VIKSYRSLLFVALASALVLGCKPKNPNLYGVATPTTPPVANNEVYTGETFIPADRPIQPDIPEGTRVDVPPPPSVPAAERITKIDSEIFKPKLDMVVLMDPSDSMSDDQDNLRRNVRLLSENFARKMQFIDLHLGVVSAWDSISFAGQNKACGLGQLRPIGGNQGSRIGDCALSQNEVPYITSETDLSLWGTTLAFGVESFRRNSDGTVNIDSGPQHEELFSPVIAALRPESQQMNKNFRRTDAHLAVIFFTDTDDFDYMNIEQDALKQDANTRATLEREAALLTRDRRESLEVLPSEIAQFLRSQEKENVSVSVYAALGRYNDFISKRGNTTGVYTNADFYIQQPGRGPRKMVELLNLMNGIGFDLRDSQYGSELSKIGNDIVAKSMRRTIILDFAPNIANLQRDPIIVKYGVRQVIPKNDQTGWSYRVDKDDSGRDVHKIIINEGVQIELEPGARFSVEYTPMR